MTRKVMELDFNGKTYICIADGEKINGFNLYEKWYDRGWHRKKLAAFPDMDSVLFHVLRSKYPGV